MEDAKLYDFIMKKLIYPQLALLLLATAACSSDDTPAVPVGDVTLVAAQPQNVDINAPEQTSVPQRADFSGTMSYAGGQTISYSTLTVAGEPIAFVTAVGGTNSTVVIPSTLTLKNGENNVNFTVVGWNLNNYQGIGEGIQTLRIAGTVRRWYERTSSNAMRNMTTDDWTQVINQSSDLKTIELGAGFTGWCSIQGAVYTEDMETFVCCPRGREGEFVVANGVKAIAPYAFDECSKLTRIVLPASVELISDNAMIFDGSLLALDILAPRAPKAGEYAFGSFARNAKLRVPQSALNTYFPEEFTKNAPELPEKIFEITDASAAKNQNTAATAALYVEACNLYAGLVQNYSKVLASYKDLMTYYTSDSMVDATYVSKIEAFVEVKNAYFQSQREYAAALSEYNTAANAIDEQATLVEQDIVNNAFAAAKEKADATDEAYAECVTLSNDASQVYADRLETYEDELNNSEEYAGYKFFNAANISAITFNVK